MPLTFIFTFKVVHDGSTGVELKSQNLVIIHHINEALKDDLAVISLEIRLKWVRINTINHLFTEYSELNKAIAVVAA